MPFRLNCISGVPETLQREANIVCFYFCPAGPAADVPVEQWDQTCSNPSKPCWDLFKSFGGCGGIETVKTMAGLLCDTDLSIQKVQDIAPGVTGTLCDKCATSCFENGQDVCSGGPAVTTAAPETPAGESLPGRVVGCPRGGPLCPAPHPPCDRIGSIVCGLFV